MTPTPDSLFDPAPYGPGERPARARADRQPNATYDPSWFVLGRNGKEPDSVMHRYSTAHRADGGIITVCGKIGRRIRVADEVREGAPIFACQACLEGRDDD